VTYIIKAICVKHSHTCCFLMDKSIMACSKAYARVTCSWTQKMEEKQKIEFILTLHDLRIQCHFSICNDLYY
jgi:hypothetical protein